MPTPVYDDVLTRESAHRLGAIVRELPEPVALCGGHAVRYRVRDQWNRQFNQEYFGSRDIDVAYLVVPEWTDEELRQSALGRAPGVLERIGYARSGSYRFEAILDGKGRPLREAPGFPALMGVDYHYLYVDTLATASHPRAKAVLRFDPIVDPTLAIMFRDADQRTTLADLGPNVYLPSTPLLVATKLASLPARGDQGDKAVKDLCDLYALLQYGGSRTVEVAAVVHRALTSVADLVNRAMRHAELATAANHLDVAETDLRAVIGPLAVPPRRG